MRKLFCIVCFLPFYYHSQKAIVSDEIHSPLAIPLNLSTLFGDICPNHLHMGLDFRTNGVEGVPIFSIREGYVSRIRVSRGGYGKVLYVNHPNGHTSVYAHCSKFFGNIDSLVSKWQVERQENEIDTNLNALILPVIKGQQIAFSGNSGSSTGPHLHFEIRETLNEIALNPLEHGFQLIDETPPVIEAIKIVPVSREGFVIENIGVAVPPFLESSKSAETTPLITLPTNQFSNSSSIGIMVKGGDRMKINGNKFDFYKSEVYFDSTLVFKCVMDSVSFNHTRYVNDYCDYKAFKIGKVKWHKLFFSEGNPLNIYKLNKTTEFLSEFSSKKIHVRIVVSDKNNLSNSYVFWLNPFNYNNTKVVFDSTTYYLPKKVLKEKNGIFDYNLDAYTLIQPIKRSNLLSSSVPLSKAAIFETQTPNQNPSQSYIKIDGKYSKSYNTGERLITETKSLGIPSLAWDSISPKISTTSYSENDTTYSKSTLKWVISDFHSEIGYYALYINDEFKPVYYDLKTNSISLSTYNLSKGYIEIRLIVRDVFGNESIHKKTLNLM